MAGKEQEEITERKKYGRDEGKDGRKRGNCFNLNECGEGRRARQEQDGQTHKGNH